MSVTNRIRLVGAVATSLVTALAVVVLLGVWASDALPGALSLVPAGALMGLLVTTSVCVAMAVSLDATDRRLVANLDATPQLQSETSYQFPPA
jgi:hypothetical protein